MKDLLSENRPIFPRNLLVICGLLILLIISHLSAAGSGKIAGKIIDATSGEPLTGVNVVITELSMGGSSDNEGEYYIANLPVGTYSVTVSMIGYARHIAVNIKVSNDNTTKLDFQLAQTVLEGEEILVTAERVLIDVDNTSSTIIVDSDELFDRTTTELTEVLSTLPSINVDDGEMTIRGGDIEEVSFIVDGTRIRNPLDHSPYTNLNLSSIEELQVITGAFNAEYGEARSGVINIISKDGSDNYEFAIDTRYVPPGKKHWGVSLYDIETDLYWENSHARHLDWWIEYPDMWTDESGRTGNDPLCSITPEQAYENYLETHIPLNDYLNLPSYQVELSLGGPAKIINNLFFFSTLKYRSQAPLFGNSYLEKGQFLNGTLKLKYEFSSSTKLTYSGFWGKDETSWGIDGPPDYFYALFYGVSSRYAYYDWPGLPELSTSGQTILFSHMFNPNTISELKLSRINAKRKQWDFPDDPIGWEATEGTFDNLRATVSTVDTAGRIYVHQAAGGYLNAVGYHTTGYYYRFNDSNTEWVLSGFWGSQRNKAWYVKSGFEFTYYILDHFNQAKFPSRRDDKTYKPYQAAIYLQNKLEYSGFIMNAGLRFDVYNPNDTVYTNLFDPMGSGQEKTKLFSQLSPRLGISHPISDKSVLHFSYGHFFQRASFGDYGEGNDGAEGSLTTFIVDGSNTPWVLGNRNLQPLKTVAFEIGLERSILDIFSLDITGFYKDIRNTIKYTFVESPFGNYTTTGNGNYADFKGIELSLRKLPVERNYGALWGYLNYTAQIGIDGRSGAPATIRYDGKPSYNPSGDYIWYTNPRFKAGLFYATPEKINGIKALLANITLSFEYYAIYPHEKIFEDIFIFEGKSYLRPTDENANLRVRKGIAVANGSNISLFCEIHNLFNHKWIYLTAIESASQEDQRKFVESDFEDIPDYDLNGIPLFEAAKYRNLPRSILFGLTLEL